MEFAPYVAKSWTQEPRTVCNATSIHFTLSLQQRNVDKLKRLALLVSTPNTPIYGHFAAQRMIDDMTAPSSEAIGTVTRWLEAERVEFKVVRQLITVSLSVGRAVELLHTRFSWWTQAPRCGQLRSVLRASTYSLPAPVAQAVTAVYGLHGLPLNQPCRTSSGAELHAMSTEVTPSVLALTYHIDSSRVNRTGSNRQAVAEFQQQLMNTSDLTTFFRREVTGARQGDDRVRRFVGAPYVAGRSVEASLDVQYLMGLSPGVATEVWSWTGADFCADMHNFTHALLSAADPPLVMSISYGFQRNLSEVGCGPAEVHDIDVTLAKLALRGITLVVASGDQGSGYEPPECSATDYIIGVQAVGDVERQATSSLAGCCSYSAVVGASGWTWVEGAAAQLNRTQPNDAQPKYTQPDHTYTFRSGALVDGYRIANGSWTLNEAFSRCSGLADCIGVSFNNQTYHPCATHAASQCHNIYLTTYLQINPTANWSTYLKDFSPPPPPPPLGMCTSYREVHKLQPAPLPSRQQTYSGGPAAAPSRVQLWPSWPASSPWVTAVGATKFVSQVGSVEMAADSFGSGGGFSTLFTATDAPWQSAPVAEYLRRAPTLAKFPPAAAVSAGGRATPDVALLGEGFLICDSRYQIRQHGCSWLTVGGTSAAAPVFAAMVSLLNEARLRAQQPPMGFLNPFIYAHADTFTDVTLGTNAIGHTLNQPVDLRYGYAAAPGWDAASGLGTPRFDKLLTAALSHNQGRASV